MTKIIVERDGLRVEAVSVSPKGVAEIIRIIFAESKSEADIIAEGLRDQFKSGALQKIEAIKRVREVFRGSNDWRFSLKGAKDFIEGADRPAEDL